jgi:hypothetical protein
MRIMGYRLSKNMICGSNKKKRQKLKNLFFRREKIKNWNSNVLGLISPFLDDASDLPGHGGTEGT